MIEEKGKKYFLSTWSACDCHLGVTMHNALMALTKNHPVLSIGVVDREYTTGIVRVATVYDDNISDAEIEKLESELEELLKEEYKRAGFTNVGLNRNYRTKIYRYEDLGSHGYRDKDIKYCFHHKSIFRKEIE